MREILIDYERMQNREKRGEFKTQIALDEAVSFGSQEELDIVAVDKTLKELESLDKRQSNIAARSLIFNLMAELTLRQNRRQAR